MRQGIVYDQVEEIPGTIYHMLPVSAQKFKNTKGILRIFYKEGSSMSGRRGRRFQPEAEFMSCY